MLIRYYVGAYNKMCYIHLIHDELLDHNRAKGVELNRNLKYNKKKAI